MRFHSIKEREMKFHQCERKKMCASSLKSLEFITQRGIKFNLGKVRIHKGRVHQAEKEEEIHLTQKKCKCIEARKKSRERIKFTKGNQVEKNMEGKISTKVNSIKR